MLVLTDVIARATHLSLQTTPTTASCGPRDGMRLTARSLAHMRMACMVLDGKRQGPKTVAMIKEDVVQWKQQQRNGGQRGMTPVTSEG